MPKHRNWPGGTHTCSKCGKTYKQRASLSAHLIAGGCKRPKQPRHRYPKAFREYLMSQGRNADGSERIDNPA